MDVWKILDISMGNKMDEIKSIAVTYDAFLQQTNDAVRIATIHFWS
mgnify:CR=1 FL=1